VDTATAVTKEDEENESGGGDDEAEGNDEENEEDDDDKEVDISKLGQKSGLTDRQRRELRANQRALFQQLDDSKLDLQAARKRNNRLFRTVKHTREAVLDSENVKAISAKAAKSIEKMIQAPRYDANRLVNKLVQKCKVTSGGSNYFDWEMLGEQCSVCYNAVPSKVSFLNGPLTDGTELQVRQRAQRQRHVAEEKGEEAEPEAVKEQVKNADQLSATEKTMSKMFKVLKRRCETSYLDKKGALVEAFSNDLPAPIKKKLRKHGPEINAVQFLFNPQSFTQTVENIFHYSFLVKKGLASIARRDKEESTEAKDEEGRTDGPEWESGPVCRTVQADKSKGPSASHAPPRQAIVSLTMKDWRDLCRAYNVERGDLPHRTGSQFARGAPSASQSITTASSQT